MAIKKDKNETGDISKHEESPDEDMFEEVDIGDEVLDSIFDDDDEESLDDDLDEYEDDKEDEEDDDEEEM